MKKLNNKGFTIAEVLVSFSLITIILASLISSTVYFRDRLKQEEVISQLKDFKNSITKIIYDDILNKHITGAGRCFAEANCIEFTDINNTSYYLKLEESSNGVYLIYNNNKYLLPDSDLGDGVDRVCDFIGGFELLKSDNYPLYKVKTSFYHKDFDIKYDIIITLS